MLDDVTFLVQRQRIVDMLHGYCRAVDDGRTDQAAALFAPEARFVSSTGRNGEKVGRDAIRDRLTTLLAGFSATSHHLSNIVVAFVDAEHARSVSYLYAWHRFANERPDAFLWARYHDELVRLDDHWYIADRILRVTGDQDMPFGWQPPEPTRVDLG